MCTSLPEACPVSSCSQIRTAPDLPGAQRNPGGGDWGRYAPREAGEPGTLGRRIFLQVRNFLGSGHKGVVWSAHR